MAAYLVHTSQDRTAHKAVPSDSDFSVHDHENCMHALSFPANASVG